MGLADELKYDANGLIPAVIQDHETGRVLMVGWMNRDTVRMTLDGDRPVFWSRSRQKVWVKGETSGHTQRIRGIYTDCDKDVLLIQVEQVGAACHEGYRSCFYRRVVGGGAEDAALEVVEERLAEPG